MSGIKDNFGTTTPFDEIKVLISRNNNIYLFRLKSCVCRHSTQRWRSNKVLSGNIKITQQPGKRFFCYKIYSGERI